MQALVYILITILAGSAETDELILSVQRKHSQQSIRIYRENGQQKCDTENQPPFNLLSDPLIGLKMPQQSKILIAHNCVDTVEIRKQKALLKGCLEDHLLKEIVNKLNSACRY